MKTAKELKKEFDLFMKAKESYLLLIAEKLNLPDIQDYIDLANSKGITLRFKSE